jgi:hypothetical protein
MDFSVSSSDLRLHFLPVFSPAGTTMFGWIFTRQAAARLPERRARKQTAQKQIQQNDAEWMHTKKQEEN